jgi:16S rRNA (guanine527-N7)-methyltransferase
MEILQAEAEKLGLKLTPAQLHAFERYYELLIEWNRRVNLTTITEPAEVQIKHFLDSLTCLLALEPAPEGGWRAGAGQGLRMVDVGSGAGFPGLPLKIARPWWQVTLLEAVGKRTAFLEAVASELGLDGVTVIKGRAEELGQNPSHREAYDVVVARAVAELRVLCEYALPLCRVGGVFVAQKGSAVEPELDQARRAMEVLGGRLDAMMPVWLPTLDQPRHLVRILKVEATPQKYPRRPGMPKKRPL